MENQDAWISEIQSGTISREGDLASQPHKIDIQMKPHQLRILYEMRVREQAPTRYTSHANFGILCDKVGAGKSLSILSLIADQKFVDIDDGQKSRCLSSVPNNFHMTGFNFQRDKQVQTNLIVVPHGTFGQWQQYISTMTKLKCLSISTKKQLQQLQEDDILYHLNLYDIVLLKDSKYNDFAQIFHQQVESPQQSTEKKVSMDSNSIYCQLLKHLHELQFTIKTKFSMTQSIYRYVEQMRDLCLLIQQIDIENTKKQTEKMDTLKKLLVTNNEMSIDCFQVLSAIQQQAMSIQPIQLEILQQIQNSLSIVCSIQHLEICQRAINTFQCENQIKIQDLCKDISPEEQLVNYVEHLNTYIFQRVIFDEANSIKIQKAMPLYGKFMWFITSSIESIAKCNRRFSSTGFIKDLFKQCNLDSNLQHFRHHIFLKNEDIYVDESFSVPDYLIQNLKCYSFRDLRILQDFAFPGIIRALNAGDVRSAIEMLGCESIKSQDVVQMFVEKIRSDIDQKIEKTETKKIKLQQLEFDDLIDQQVKVQKKYTLNKSIEKSIQKIEQLQEKLTGICERIQQSDTKDCSICLDIIKTPCIIPCCKNTFCLECITHTADFQQQFRDDPNIHCPLCRAKVPLQSLLVINNDTHHIPQETRTKIQTLIDIVKNDGKFLVFSEFDNTFVQIQRQLQKENIPFSKLCGTGSHIQNLIDQFKAGQVKVLMLNAKHFGAGLNLQMATDIIIYHKMKPDLEMQVIGRGQRPGRESPLKVTYLLHQNEI